MLSRWWAALSEESRAAVIAAIVSPIVAELLGLRARMIRWFYMRTLDKLESARRRLDNEFERQHPLIISDSGFAYSLDQLAKKAEISTWRAKAAVKWRNRVKEFGIF